MKNNKIQRIDYIDAVKGIGIILVILGHTSFFGLPDIIYKIIYSFHMPLFFIVSGFLYNKSKYDKMPFKHFLKSNFRSYIIPYFIFAFVNLVIVVLYDFYSSGFDFSAIKDEIIKYVFGIICCYSNMQHMPNCSPLWFLCCLFFARIVFYLIHKYIARYGSIVALLISIVSFILSENVTFMLPLKIATVPVAVSFIELGYLIRKYEIIENSKWWYCFAAVPGVIAAILNKGEVGMNENEYGNYLLFVCSSVLISYSLILVCSKIKFLSNKFILFMGKCSITIIGYNFFLRTLTTEFYYLIPYIKTIQINWISSFILTLLFSAVFGFLSNYGIFKVLLKGKISLHQ